MPILSIRHVTAYHYHQPVAFGAHRMMLLPRDDDDQKVLHSEIEITPKPWQLAWTRDVFGNHVATASFADRAAELRFVSNIRLDHAPASFHAIDIEDFARIYPFAYAADDWPALERYTQPPSALPNSIAGAPAFFRDDGSADTHDLLVDMTQTIRRTFKHAARHEKGDPGSAATLSLGSGSCRDLAMLMIAALRSRGIAARFVSGYVHLPKMMTTTNWIRRQHPCLGPGLCSRTGLGRLRSVGRHRRESEPRPRRGCASPARGDPAARHVVRKRVGSSAP